MIKLIENLVFNQLVECYYTNYSIRTTWRIRILLHYDATILSTITSYDLAITLGAVEANTANSQLTIPFLHDMYNLS